MFWCVGVFSPSMTFWDFVIAHDFVYYFDRFKVANIFQMRAFSSIFHNVQKPFKNAKSAKIHEKPRWGSYENAQKIAF